MRTKTPQQADKILEAAGRLFSSQRFHETRMEDIAAAAEVGKGTLYRYFDDKEKLYVALLSRSADEMSARLQAVRAASASPCERLVRVVGVYLDYFEEHPHLLDLIQHAEALHRPPAVFPWQKARDEAMQILAEEFEEGKRTNAFIVADPHTASLMLIGGIRSVIRFGTRPHAEGLARRIVKQFLDGAAVCCSKSDHGSFPTP